MRVRRAEDPLFLKGSVRREQRNQQVHLVVLADEETQRTVARLLTGKEPPPISSGPRGGVSVKAGKLNLIFTANTDEVERWRLGTNELISLAPVARDYAVQHLRAVVGDSPDGEA